MQETHNEQYLLLQQHPNLFQLFLVGFQIMFCDKLIMETSKGKIFKNSIELPKYKTVMVLGTSKYLKDGQINLYFQNRINQTIRLYKSGNWN